MYYCVGLRSCTFGVGVHSVVAAVFTGGSSVTMGDFQLCGNYSTMVTGLVIIME